MSRGFPGAAPSQMASRKLLVSGAGLASVGCGGPVPGGAGRSSLTEGRTGRSEKQESKGCWEPGYLPAGGRELGRPPWSGCELGVQCLDAHGKEVRLAALCPGDARSGGGTPGAQTLSSGSRSAFATQTPEKGGSWVLCRASWCISLGQKAVPELTEVPGRASFPPPTSVVTDSVTG